jgi:hypothetical protein
MQLYKNYLIFAYAIEKPYWASNLKNRSTVIICGS